MAKMAFGKPKGKDANLSNELREPKKGLSQTEIAGLMRKMTGDQTDGNPMPLSPLLPNAGGRRGRYGR